LLYLGGVESMPLLNMENKIVRSALEIVKKEMEILELVPNNEDIIGFMQSEISLVIISSKTLIKQSPTYLCLR